MLSIVIGGAVFSCATPSVEAADRIKVFWTTEDRNGKPKTAYDQCEASRSWGSQVTGGGTTKWYDPTTYLSDPTAVVTDAYQAAVIGATGACKGTCTPYFTDSEISKQFEDGTEPYFCTSWQGKYEEGVSEAGSPFIALVNSLLAPIVRWLNALITLLAQLVEIFMAYAFKLPDGLQGIWQSFKSFTNIILGAAVFVLAVMVTLRVKADNYSIKKTLPGIITALVLVNFSWVIGLFLLDVG